MADLQSLSYERADLAAALYPRVEQDPYDPREPPPLASGGISTAGALVAIIDLALSEDPCRRTVRITVDTYDNAATYTYTQDGVANNFVATGAPLATFLAAWAADITAGTTNAVAEAVDTDGDGVVDQIKVTQIDLADTQALVIESVAGAATGTAEISMVTDPAGADMTILVRTRDSDEAETSRESIQRHAWRVWAAPSGLALNIAVEGSSASVTLPCAPYEALYCFVPASSLTAVAGDQTVGTASNCAFSYGVLCWIRPCLPTGTV